MHRENDEYEIANEQQFHSSFESENEISKLSFLAQFQKKYENKFVTYLSKYFLELDSKRINNQYTPYLAACLYKLSNEQKTQNPHIMTRILAQLQITLLKVSYLNELNIAFLQSCIITYNYKIGYQFIKKKVFLQGNCEKKSYIFVDYFYFSGIIAQAQKDFDEALRCYKLAYKFNLNGHATIDAQKMDTLLCFRLGLELRNWSNSNNQSLVVRLSNILDDKQQKDTKDVGFDYEESDTNMCIREWQLQAKLHKFLANESELHSKVSFGFIMNNFKIQNEENLIEYLLQINKIHNMFLINEEKQYIEFKYNNLTYKDINSKLEGRYNLLQSLASIK